METIESLKNIGFNSIFLSFKDAFEDYEMQLTKDELYTMLQRRGFVPELSFGAFEDGKLVAFTLNGIGYFNNTKTAYDTGTGTTKEYRGRGIASKIFLHSIPFLVEANVEQYLLEVLQHNTKAHSIYSKLGFIETREFNYFVQKNENIKFKSSALLPDYQIKTLDIEQIKSLDNFFDFVPSWQNSFESISRKLSDFKIIGIIDAQKILGYCIFEPISGDITQIAVDKQYRRQGIATKLIKEILKINLNDSVKIINTDIDCTSITEFLKSISVPLAGKQFEMIKKLKLSNE